MSFKDRFEEALLCFFGVAAFVIMLAFGCWALATAYNAGTLPLPGIK